MTDKIQSKLQMESKNRHQRCLIEDYELHYIAEESHECSASMIEDIESYKKQSQPSEEPSQKLKQSHSKSGQSETELNTEAAAPSILKEAKSDPCLSSQSLSDVSEGIKSAPNESPSLEISSESMGSSKEEFDKLIEITSRCIEYYNKFTDEKESEYEIIEETFSQLTKSLDASFEAIIETARQTNRDLKEYIHKKYTEVVQIKETQDEQLKSTLEAIKSTHLSNLLQGKEKFDSSSVLSSSACSSKPLTAQENPKESLENSVQSRVNDISIELHGYASTLNQFYSLMGSIQKLNYKQMVQDSVNFLGNLITQEIKNTLFEKIPQKLQQSVIQSSINQSINRGACPETSAKEETKCQPFFNLYEEENFTKLFTDTSVRKMENYQNLVGEDSSMVDSLFKQVAIKDAPTVEQSSNSSRKVSTTQEVKPMSKQAGKEGKKTQSTPRASNGQKVNFIERNKILAKSKQKGSSALSKSKTTVPSIYPSKLNRASSNVSKSPTNISKCKEPHFEQTAMLTPQRKVSDSADHQTELKLVEKILSQQWDRGEKISGYKSSVEEIGAERVLQETQNSNSKVRDRSKSPSNLVNNSSKGSKNKHSANSIKIKSPAVQKNKSPSRQSLNSGRGVSSVVSSVQKQGIMNGSRVEAMGSSGVRRTVTLL